MLGKTLPIVVASKTAVVFVKVGESRLKVAVSATAG
jgi:flagellar biogenesis protein FliO